MGRVPEAVANVYVATGVLSIVIFVIGLTILLLTSPDGVGQRELYGFVAGFSLYMFVYFIAMGAYHLVTSEPDVEIV